MLLVFTNCQIIRAERLCSAAYLSSQFEKHVYAKTCFMLEGYMTFWISSHNNVGVKIRKDYNKRSSKRKKKESLNGFSSGNRPLNQMLHFRLDLSTMYDIWYLFQSTMQMESRVQNLFSPDWLVKDLTIQYHSLSFQYMCRTYQA